MGIFDKYLIKEKDKEKKNIALGSNFGGGWGLSNLIKNQPQPKEEDVEEEPKPYKPIDFDLFLNAPSTEEISEKQDKILTLENDYETLNTTVNEDWKTIKELDKQLKDLEADYEIAPPQMQIKIETDYNGIRDTYNALIDKNNANATRLNKIKEEYDSIRPEFDKDIDIYNKWAEAENRKPPEPKKIEPPDIGGIFTSEGIAQQLKGKTYRTGEKENPTWGESLKNWGIAGLYYTATGNYKATALIQEGMALIDDAMGELILVSPEKVKKFEEKYGFNPYHVPDLIPDMGKRAEEMQSIADKAMAETKSRNWLQNLTGQAIVPAIPVVMDMVLTGGVSPTMTGINTIYAAPWKETLSSLGRMFPFMFRSTGQYAMEIEEKAEALGKEFPYWQRFIAATALGGAEGASELEFFLGITSLAKKPALKTIDKGAKTLWEIYGTKLGTVAKALGSEFRQEATMPFIQNPVEKMLGLPADISLKGMTKEGLKQGAQAMPMVLLLTGITGGVGGSSVIAARTKRILGDIIEKKDSRDIREGMKQTLEDLGFMGREPEAEAFAYEVVPEKPNLENLKKELAGRMTEKRIFLEEIEKEIGEKIDIEKVEDIQTALDFVKKKAEPKAPVDIQWEQQKYNRFKNDLGEDADFQIDFIQKQIDQGTSKHDIINGLVQRQVDEGVEPIGNESTVWLSNKIDEKATLKDFEWKKKAEPKAPGKGKTPKAEKKPYTATVYRGTKEGVAPTDEGLFGEGTYYSTNKEVADTYGEVLKTKVKLLNPFIIDGQEEADKFWNETTRPAKAKAIKEGETPKKADIKAAEFAREFLEEKGYDGIVVKDVQFKGDEVVVFHPEKVEVEIPEAISKEEGEKQAEAQKVNVNVNQQVEEYTPKTNIKYSNLISKPYMESEGFYTNGQFAIKGEIPDKLKKLKNYEFNKTKPKITEILPDISNEPPAKILGVIEAKEELKWETDFVVGIQNNKGELAVVKKDFIDLVMSQYPKSTPYFSGEYTPIVFKEGEDVKAVVMPIRTEGGYDEIFKVGAKVPTVYYRGGKEGNFITEDEEFAEEYGEVTEYTLPENLNLLNVISEEAEKIANEYDKNVTPEDLWFNPNKKLVKLLDKYGYDGFINDKNIFISHRENLKAIPKAKIKLVPPKKTAEKPIESEPKKSLEELLKDAQKEINRLKGIIKTIKGNKEKRAAFKKELVAYIKKNMPYPIQNKMLATVKNVTGEKALEQAMEKIDQYTLEYYKREYIKKILNELTAKKIEPKKSKSGMLKGRFTPEIQDKLDFIRAHIKGNRAEALEKIQKNNENFDKGEAINIAEENELLNMVGIKEMDLETLQLTLANIKRIKNKGRTIKAEKAEANRARHEKDFVQNTETITGKKVEIDEETGKAIIDSSYKTLPKTKKWGWIKKTIDSLTNWQYHWDSLLDKLSFFDKKSLPFKSLLSLWGSKVHYARVANMRGLEEALAMTQFKFADAFESTSKRGIMKDCRKLQEEVDLGTFKNSEGSPVHFVLTKGQILKKVMQFDDSNIKERKIFEEGMFFTDEIKDAFRKVVTPKEMAYIKGVKEVYKYMHGRISPQFEEIYGVHFGDIEDYSGVALTENDTDIDVPVATLMARDAYQYSSILNPSLKARGKAKVRLQYDDITGSLMNYVMQMEHWLAWAKPLQDLRSYFGDGRTRSIIGELYGKDVLRKIDGFLDDMTRDGVDKGKIIQWVDQIRFKFTRAILAKPHIGIKQIPSVLAYMTEMPVQDFFKGVSNFWKNPIVNYRYLIEHSPYARERFGEGFERDIHGEMQKDYVHLMANSEKIGDLMMGSVRAGDKFAVMQGMWAVFYSETNGQCKKASDAKVEDAMMQATIVTERTQPSFSTESLATGQRGGSLLKIFTMFQTQPNKYFQLIANNARNFRAGRGSRAKAASNIVLAWAILPMIFQFIGDGGKWIKKHQLRAFILGGVNDILVFGSMIRSMYGWLIEEGYDIQESPLFGTLREVEFMLAKVAKWRDPDRDITPEDIQKFCEHFAKGIGQLVGLPTPYGVQVSQAIRDKDVRQLLFSKYILELENEKPKAKKPYIKSYSGEKYSKYLKGKYNKTGKYTKYLKKY